VSWVTEDGLHEGYAAHVARDGRCATATMSAGMVMSSSQVAGEWVDEVLDWSELIGWEARCECGWVGPMYRRAGDEQEPGEHQMIDALQPDAEEAIRAAWLIHEAAHPVTSWTYASMSTDD